MEQNNSRAKKIFLLLILATVAGMYPLRSHAACDPSKGEKEIKTEMDGTVCYRDLTLSEKLHLTYLYSLIVCSSIKDRFDYLISRNNVKIYRSATGQQLKSGMFVLSSDASLKYWVSLQGSLDTTHGDGYFYIADDTMNNLSLEITKPVQDIIKMTLFAAAVQHEMAHIFFEGGRYHELFYDWLDAQTEGTSTSPKWSTACPDKIMLAAHEVVAGHWERATIERWNCPIPDNVWDSGYYLDKTAQKPIGSGLDPVLGPQVFHHFLHVGMRDYCEGTKNWPTVNSSIGWGCSKSLCDHFGWSHYDPGTGNLINRCGSNYHGQSADRLYPTPPGSLFKC